MFLSYFIQHPWRKWQVLGSVALTFETDLNTDISAPRHVSARSLKYVVESKVFEILIAFSS